MYHSSYFYLPERKLYIPKNMINNNFCNKEDMQSKQNRWMDIKTIFFFRDVFKHIFFFYAVHGISREKIGPICISKLLVSKHVNFVFSDEKRANKVKSG